MSLFERTLFYFTRISEIPRASGKEEKISAFLTEFALSRGLTFYADTLGNVCIKKEGTKGRKTSEPILLQGHTDMVCEAEAGCGHDFNFMPLTLCQEGDSLFAKGTTLGADNGIAVALMLALLEDTDLPHPPLECLFTVQEETTMAGAESVDPAWFSSRRLLNLDSVEKDGITVGSAGSGRMTFSFPYDTTSFRNKPFRIHLFGLSGGHSGSEIDHGHTNAILLCGELLTLLYEEMPFRIVSLSCDGKSNAIPRECTATLSVTDPVQAKKFALAWSKAVRTRLPKADQQFRLHLDSCRKPQEMLSFCDTSRILSFLSLLPNGVLERSPILPGLVQTSSNVGIVSTENGVFSGTVMLRSSSDHALSATTRRMERLAKVTDLALKKDVFHPAWQFSKEGVLAKDYADAYKEVTGNPIMQNVIHAGLECGSLCNRLSITDAISVGPDISGIHTPEERLSLSSLSRFCDTVALLLSRL